MHNWTDEENLICCRLYLEYALDRTPYKSTAELKDKVRRALPQIVPASLEKKLANIKYLSNSEQAARQLFPNGDGVRLGALSNASEQCRRAFYCALKEFSFGRHLSYEELYACCKAYLDHYYSSGSLKTNKLINELREKLPHSSQFEIENNLKKIIELHHKIIKPHQTPSSLNGFDLQLIKAFSQALQDTVDELNQV